MDPLSITTACVGLVGSVTKISIQISDFVRKAREARGDLDRVSRELVSLKTVLEILSEDAGTGKGFPDSLKHAGGGITPAVKWTLFGRDDMDKLRSSLEAHKSALDIALDMVALSITREIKADTQEIRNDTSAIKEDTTQILAEIARLQARLPEDERLGSANGFALQRYLDNLTSYVESSWEISDMESDHRAEVTTPRGESLSPPPNNVSPLVPNVIKNKVKVNATWPTVYQVPSKNYNISRPIHTQQQDGKESSTRLMNPDPSPSKAYKRSNHISGIFARTNPIFGGKSSSHKEEQTTIPKSISTTSISRPPSGDRASRKSTDSRRSISFGLGFKKRRSGSLSVSEHTIQQDKPIRFSERPASFSPNIARAPTPTHLSKYDNKDGEMGLAELLERMRTRTFRALERNYNIPDGDYLINDDDDGYFPIIGADNVSYNISPQSLPENRYSRAQHKRPHVSAYDDDRQRPQPTLSQPSNRARTRTRDGYRTYSSDDDRIQSKREPSTPHEAQLPPQNRQAGGRGILVKNNHKFTEAYEQERDHGPQNYRNETGSSGAARHVMDWFRARQARRAAREEDATKYDI
ncbi:hypothetical protein L207DRAFT_593211 [Hyaloscypha variabilis F]|uniref:Fungal N-terminal domain-containing protein n=1 Tax=Hyaloscypha variabilis (strain UAMH 11265 / GT02V1 / F) TaxID=1149755 RepID=A0A2J6QTQ6_HYAVF|nr:hypothetical protein L207DRAFT_593211 [Hyaloscypha variabilis F]